MFCLFALKMAYCSNLRINSQINNADMLEQYIQSYFGIPNKSLQIVAALFEEESLARTHYFAKAGQYCKKLSFIKEGNRLPPLKVII